MYGSIPENLIEIEEEMTLYSWKQTNQKLLFQWSRS